MPDLRPFRGTRYSPQAGSPGDLTAPPYDVISRHDHAALCRRSPNNIVRLILGECPPTDDWYAQAASTMAAWRHSGILHTDPRPAFYLYTQTFDHKGRSRKLLLGALRLEPYETARILPHENTMPGPKADRLRLIQATHANLSPILGFFPDRDGTVNRLLDTLAAAEPAVDFTDDHAIAHQLRLIEDGQHHAALSEALTPLPFYIADGHHRYETALAYQRLQRAAAPAETAELPCDFTLAACMSAADPGLVIRPTHRVAHWHGDPAPEALLREAGRFFDLTRLDAGGPDEALAALEPRPSRPAFVVYAGTPPGYTLVELREPAAVSNAPYPEGSPARRLPATVFAHALLAPFAGESQSLSLTYTADPHEAVASVTQADARLAALLPSVETDELMAVVDAGQRMPPKSTFFWPKPLTGMVLRPLEAP